MRMEWADALRGAAIYAAGDTAAACLRGEFLWTRLLGVALVGGTIYAWEVPRYFAWIQNRWPAGEGGWWRGRLSRALAAMVYFNPLWIARHMLLLKIASLAWGEIGWGLLRAGVISFAVNIPISALGNYLIQNHVHLPWRFTASATFSGVMAMYYALSAAWFGGLR